MLEMKHLTLSDNNKRNNTGQEDTEGSKDSMYANYFGLLIYQRKLCLKSTHLQPKNCVEGQAQGYD